MALEEKLNLIFSFQFCVYGIMALQQKHNLIFCVCLWLDGTRQGIEPDILHLFQLVFVSIGASRPPRKHDGSTPASYLTPPPREKLPMMLLLAEPHFGQIFGLLQDLSNLKCSLSDIVSSMKNSDIVSSMKNSDIVSSMKNWFIAWIW